MFDTLALILTAPNVTVHAFETIVVALLPLPPKVMGGYVFARIGIRIARNIPAPIPVRLSPNLVSHTLGHRGQGD